MKLKNFTAKEFVSKVTFERHGNKSLELIDRELMLFMDFLHGFCARLYEGKCSIVINDWAWREGGFQDRGLRDVEYYTDTERAKERLKSDDTFSYYKIMSNGAIKFNESRSRHKVGMAADFDVYIDGKRIHPDVIRKLIIDNRREPGFTAIRFIESGVNWVHVSTEATDHDQLIVWNVNGKQTDIYSRI